MGHERYIPNIRPQHDIGDEMDKRNPICMQVEWYDMDGKFHTDYFCTIEFGIANWGMSPSYVHKTSDVAGAVRTWVSHIPLHSVAIEQMA